MAFYQFKSPTSGVFPELSCPWVNRSFFRPPPFEAWLVWTSLQGIDGSQGGIFRKMFYVGYSFLSMRKEHESGCEEVLHRDEEASNIFLTRMARIKKRVSSRRDIGQVYPDWSDSGLKISLKTGPVGICNMLSQFCELSRPSNVTISIPHEFLRANAGFGNSGGLKHLS